MTRRHATPLGAVVGGLLRGKLSTRTILDRHCGAARHRLELALTRGSLVTGEIGKLRSRELESQAARRMLATYLMHLEAYDGTTAHGSAIWQGSIARRLALSTRRRPPTSSTPRGAPGGVREVQRYVAILEAAQLIRAAQPDAARVPDAMRARARWSLVGGLLVRRRWAYNVVRLLALPWELLRLRALAARARPAVDRARLEARAMQAMRAALAVADTAADAARAILAYLRDRPPPLGV
jgi:hypothetical protein